MKTSKRPIEYLQDIFDIAGGATKLAASLDIHAITAEGWRKSGIPQKYWERIIKLYNISPAELFHVSKNCRRSVK